jgi:hypothetical protein
VRGRFGREIVGQQLVAPLALLDPDNVIGIVEAADAPAAEPAGNFDAVELDAVELGESCGWRNPWKPRAGEAL